MEAWSPAAQFGYQMMIASQNLELEAQKIAMDRMIMDAVNSDMMRLVVRNVAAKYGIAVRPEPEEEDPNLRPGTTFEDYQESTRYEMWKNRRNFTDTGDMNPARLVPEDRGSPQRSEIAMWLRPKGSVPGAVPVLHDDDEGDG